MADGNSPQPPRRAASRQQSIGTAHATFALVLIAGVVFAAAGSADDLAPLPETRVLSRALAVLMGMYLMVLAASHGARSRWLAQKMGAKEVSESNRGQPLHKHRWRLADQWLLLTAAILIWWRGGTSFVQLAGVETLLAVMATSLVLSLSLHHYDHRVLAHVTTKADHVSRVMRWLRWLRWTLALLVFSLLVYLELRASYSWVV